MATSLQLLRDSVPQIGLLRTGGLSQEQINIAFAASSGRDSFGPGFGTNDFFSGGIPNPIQTGPVVWQPPVINIPGGGGTISTGPIVIPLPGGIPGGGGPPGGVPGGVPGGGCSPPLRMDVNGLCVSPGSPGDISVGGGIPGVAVMGRYGAAESPMTFQGVRRQCPTGTVLGKDNLCYDKLRKDQRKWPPGRRPLLTGGDLNAISKASRAATRLENKTKQLQKLGMMKRPHTHRKKG